MSKRVKVLGGYTVVDDTFEVRSERSEGRFGLGDAYAAARGMHPELDSIALLNTRWVDVNGATVEWNDSTAVATVWTFELPFVPGDAADYAPTEKGHTMTRASDYSRSQLEAMPTLSVGQDADLKVDTGEVRVWLSRMTRADGATKDHAITVERKREDGTWG